MFNTSREYWVRLTSLICIGTLILSTIYDIGAEHEAYTTDGGMVITSIILLGGIWALGYFSKK